MTELKILCPRLILTGHTVALIAEFTDQGTENIWLNPMRFGKRLRNVIDECGAPLFVDHNDQENFIIGGMVCNNATPARLKEFTGRYQTLFERHLTIPVEVSYWIPTRVLPRRAA